LQQVLNKINPKNLFLIDGFGALLSAFSLGIVLVKFEEIVGMPQRVLYILALMACIFAVYSFSCYLRVNKNWRPFLKAIAFANLLYCCLTIGLVLYFYQSLTALGILYFVLEIIVILLLVSIELKMASSAKG